MYLFKSCDNLVTFLVSQLFVADNSAIDEVRVELVLTNSFNVVFPIVAAVDKL